MRDPAVSTPTLIALDWGTSNLRASLLGVDGRVLDTRSAPAGVMAVPERRFDAALLSVCGDWLAAHRGCACIASGMIGSRQGWLEAPYLDCPANPMQAARRLSALEFGQGHRLHIVPGLKCVDRNGNTDVMRGEETQLWGADLAPGTCCVLPGTHSKWAWLGDDDCIDAFQTWMTGEVYALLTQHGILGRLMQFGGDFVATAFDDGVRLGLEHPGELLHTLFAARTAGLMGERSADALPDFLSGLLIGSEIAAARGCTDVAQAVLLGDSALCDRYARAMRSAGVAVQRAVADATTRGQWRVAQAAGLTKDWS